MSNPNTNLTTAQKEKMITDYMDENPQGVSTANILKVTGLSKAECMGAISRLKTAGVVTVNGTRGKDRWIHKPKESYPLISSIWHFADYIKNQFSNAGVQHSSSTALSA